MSRGPLCPCGVLRTDKRPTYLLALTSLPSPQEPSAILKWLGLDPTTKLARTTPMRVEPKTFFANERTFLTWLNMAVTISSISAALIGFTTSTQPDAAAPGPNMARQLVGAEGENLSVRDNLTVMHGHVALT